MNFRKISVSFFSIALVALIVTGLVSSYVLPVAAEKGNTPTYVLGVFDPVDPLVVKLNELTSSLTLLSVPTDMSLVGAGSILFVDGAWLGSTASVDPTVLSIIAAKVDEGVPTVTIRGGAALLGNSIPGIIRPRAPDLPLIAEGLESEGTLPDGTRRTTILQVAAGFDYAVEREFLWAEKLVQASSSIPSAPLSAMRPSKLVFAPEATVQESSLEPFWASVGNVTIDTGDFFKPVGRIITTFRIFSLQNDGGTNSYKWFNFFLDQIVQPGILIYGSDGSDWRTSAVEDSVHVVNPATNLLVDRGPDALFTAGPMVVTYEIGVEIGTLGAEVTASQTGSYELKHTTVNLTESPGTDVIWVHDIDSRTEGKSIFQIIPGWTLRVDESKPIQIQGTFDTTFERIQGTTVLESRTITFNYSVSGG